MQDHAPGVIATSVGEPVQSTSSPPLRPQAMPGLGGEPAADLSKSKDVWDKLDIVGKMFGAVLIPIMLAASSYYISEKAEQRAGVQKQHDNEQHESEIKRAATLKTEEFAITVLQSKAGPPELNDWALGVFSNMVAETGKPLPEKVACELGNTSRFSESETPDAAALVARFEGVSLTAHQFYPGGPWEIGAGHKQGVGPDTKPITMEQAMAFLKQDLKPVEAAVDSLVKVPLNENQRNALISYVYNVGELNFARSSLLSLLNAGHYDQIPDQLQSWSKTNGATNVMLAQRRKCEGKIWSSSPTPHP